MTAAESPCIVRREEFDEDSGFIAERAWCSGIIPRSSSLARTSSGLRASARSTSGGSGSTRAAAAWIGLSSDRRRSGGAVLSPG
eukprot:CAMPEP_0197454454 /NCGR_PEP_ID=MMETSP1175-20131217/38022_1 /TAXON_ID=1003142 /ORGANISM="Triceratium dubium, Strain CCMP147" /LENGTH=83 /DNA_ID=CAMNT_0042988041 /DNA_START=86 /DNA_END=337 /DNA_ORIENTATION=-